VKILHVIGSMDPVSGGPCQGIRNLNDVLKHLNIDREVVCLDDPKSAYLGNDSFPIHALGPSKTKWQYSPKLIPWLTENLARFDIVIINGIWLHYVYAVVKVLKKYRSRKIDFQNNSGNFPKSFIMLHGMLDPYFQKVRSRRLKAIRNWIYWYLIEGYNIRQVNALLFACQTEMELAKNSFKYYKPMKEINIGYGVKEPPDFTQQMKLVFSEKCPGLKDAPYLLFLGRIHPKKGVDLLINAYIEVFKINEGHNRNDMPKLVIAGPGMNTDYGNKLMKLILNTPIIGNSIFFPGMLTGDAKWGALYSSDAFVLSSHQENFGISVVEALACKKPVLISNQINIWKEINAGGGGIVKDDNLAGTIELLRYWINLGLEEKMKMVQNARSTYENNFGVLNAAMRFKSAMENN
jgi:glycosyltransferase involved in cell wall biosynthesis